MSTLLPNAAAAGSAAFAVATSPWIIVEPPDVPQQDASSYPNPWAGFDRPDRDRPERPSASQFPLNRTWDPGALADSRLDLRTPWDYLVIGGSRVTPGIAQVKAHKGQRLDRKATPGSDGETLTHLGIRCGEILVRIRLLTQDDLDQWAQIIPWLQSPPGKTRPDPVGIDHPALAMNGIKSLYVEDLGVPEPTGPGGPLEVNIRLVEFLPTKPAGTTTFVKSKVSAPNALPAPAKPSATPPVP